MPRTPLELVTDDAPRDECGVFGIYAPGEDVATLTYFGLYTLQHRGQESAGIAVSGGSRIVVHKDMGLVNQVFDTASLAALPGSLAIGHTRYSTTGSSSWPNAQPQYAENTAGDGIALAHNGNLINTHELAAELIADGSPPPVNDSAVMTELLAREDGNDLHDKILRIAPRLKGAFSVVAMSEDRLHAFRDPHGIRPLVIGRLPKGGWVVASETSALDIVGATLVRDVEPGEAVVIDVDGVRGASFAEPTPRYCLFEWVYLARPDHRQDGRSVSSARREMGMRLAREAPAEADLVIPVPDSGTPAAAGYAAEAKLPFAEGLVKNRYVGRTFIQPTDSLRQLGIRLKLSPVREVIDGQRLVVVDDSIVRGNTSKQLIAMLRLAGAAEVHLRITAPPITNPCWFGIDMATRAQLIGADMSVDQIREFVGADSLHYLSLDELIACTPTPKEALCRGCMDGEYPMDVDEDHSTAAAVASALPEGASELPLTKDRP